ncbi:hypothetical protein SKAU_G00258330 [Synaphobranchus kaupii]|uniref:Uncharacterized protein n=1 Tax=Synaphobranchus kaupii TaxID=118154 RepID=A0A9Q1F484_SYNKA|nr:hypothetical protein SKAU_G00258330 [Synaphobranchus kaupii]
MSAWTQHAPELLETAGENNISFIVIIIIIIIIIFGHVRFLSGSDLTEERHIFSRSGSSAQLHVACMRGREQLKDRLLSDTPGAASRRTRSAGTQGRRIASFLWAPRHFLRVPQQRAAFNEEEDRGG